MDSADAQNDFNYFLFQFLQCPPINKKCIKINQNRINIIHVSGKYFGNHIISHKFRVL